MTKRTDRHSQVARELVVLSHSMDAVARGLQSLGGEAELKAAELRGAAEIARQWAAHIAEVVERRAEGGR